MQQLPFELRYDLTRRQRLLPHLKIWRQHAVLVIGCVAGAAAAVQRSWWVVFPLLFCLFILRGFFAGLLNVLLVRRQPMDVVVEENGLGFLARGDRLYFFLDGLTGFDQLAAGVWTVQHWNGSVVNIPADLLNEEQVEFFRNWVTKANEIRLGLGIGRSAAAQRGTATDGPGGAVLVNRETVEHTADR